MTPLRYTASLTASVLVALTLPTQALAQPAQPEDTARPFVPRIAPIEGDVPARPITGTGVENLAALARLLAYVRYFHPSDASAQTDWNTLTIAAVQHVEEAEGPADLAGRLRAVIAQTAPEVVIFPSGEPTPPPELPSAEQYLVWRHFGLGTGNVPMYRSERVAVDYQPEPQRVDLGGGLAAWLPMGSPIGSQPQAGPALALNKPDGFTPSGFDRDTRLAAVIIAWGVLEHFFPYSDVVQLDWDGHLREALQRAAQDEDDVAFRDTLRSLLVPLQDGHAGVGYPLERLGRLPLAVDWIEGQVVVTGVGPAVEGVAVGDLIRSVDGVPIDVLIDREEALSSASPHRRRYRALQALLLGSRDRSVPVVLETASGDSVERSMSYEYSPTGVSPIRPEQVTALGGAVVYVDLSRIGGEALREHLPLLAGAAGIVFDLRGYPSGSVWYLSHLTDRTIRSADFDAPITVRPHEVTYHEGGWTIPPASPRFTSNVVFITDESAISFSESILGVVEDNRLADIIGEPTAGANGNINRMLLPGGYMFSWTGLRVTKADGSPHHAIGVQPTIPLEPSIAGVRAGRDELLERALEVVRSRLP